MEAGERCVAVTAELAQTQVLMPLVVRPIPGHFPLVDLTSAYGYWGAYADATAATSVEAAQFWQGFAEWAVAIGAVSLFGRLHLFGGEVLPPPAGATVARAPNVVRSLDLSDDDMGADFEHKVRKNVRRARQEGVTIEFDRHGERYADFAAVYSSTMERRDAAAGYRFSDRFFGCIHSEMKGSFVYAHALRASEVVSSELVLLSERHAYSFLGGTLAAHFTVRPNDLLKVEVMRWCRERGLADFVLGGGASPGDGIERYKRSFAPSGAQYFSTVQLVLDGGRYAELSSQSSGEFFPAYRASKQDAVS